jgi:hypothetical protein
MILTGDGVTNRLLERLALTGRGTQQQRRADNRRGVRRHEGILISVLRVLVLRERGVPDEALQRLGSLLAHLQPVLVQGS